MGRAETERTSKELGESSLKYNIHLNNLKTPQATGKLAREGWRAATVMKEIWFPGKLPSQEKGRWWGREEIAGAEERSRGPWCPLPAVATESPQKFWIWSFSFLFFLSKWEHLNELFTFSKPHKSRRAGEEKLFSADHAGLVRQGKTSNPNLRGWPTRQRWVVWLLASVYTWGGKVPEMLIYLQT